MDMVLALTLSAACAASVSALFGPERLISGMVDDVPSAPVMAIVAGAVIELNGPIGIVNDQGMTSKEFREALQHCEEKELRRVVLDLEVPAGRTDSVDGYLQAIKSAQEAGIEVFAFVRAATAEGWCVALSCDQWVATEVAKKSLQAALKASAVGQDSGTPQGADDGLQGQGNKGMQGRRKPPAGGGQMPGMGQGLGLSGGGEGAGDGPASGADWSSGATKQGWPGPSPETLEKLRELAKTDTFGDREAVVDRTQALKVLGTDAQVVPVGRFCATQRELRDLAGAMRKNEAELKKQTDALKSVKQKDGARAEGLQKIISGIKSRMTELQLKMAALRVQP